MIEEILIKVDKVAEVRKSQELPKLILMINDLKWKRPVIGSSKDLEKVH